MRPITPSFSRMRRRNRPREAAIAGVMLRVIRLGNSLCDELRLFISRGLPLADGELLGAGDDGLRDASNCPVLPAAVLISGPINAPSLPAGAAAAQVARSPLGAQPRVP